MTDKQFAYVEFIFFENVRKHLKKIVKDVVKKEQFYYSDVVSRIRGDVTDKIHFTLFYGLNEAVLNDKELKKAIENMDVNELKLRRLVLFDGYQGMYKVLAVEVDDRDKKLLSLSKEMLNFDHDEEHGRREFKPHITIAYVQADYVIPKKYSIKDMSIRVKKVQLSI
jgi:2'-5' RNA ligase